MDENHRQLYPIPAEVSGKTHIDFRRTRIRPKIPSNIIGSESQTTVSEMRGIGGGNQKINIVDWCCLFLKNKVLH